MSNGNERPTRVLPPTEQLVQESRRPAANVPEFHLAPPPERYSAPNAESPFRLEVVRLVKDLENEIHRIPGDEMDADEKSEIFPLLWEMTRDEKIAFQVLRSALAYHELGVQYDLDNKGLVKRLQEIDLPVLLGYIRETAPMLGVELPGLTEKEKLDIATSDQAIKTDIMAPTISQAKFQKMLEHSKKRFIK